VRRACNDVLGWFLKSAYPPPPRRRPSGADRRKLEVKRFPIGLELLFRLNTDLYVDETGGHSFCHSLFPRGQLCVLPVFHESEDRDNTLVLAITTCESEPNDELMERVCFRVCVETTTAYELSTATSSSTRQARKHKRRRARHAPIGGVERHS
jgi:hypothetical protein